MATKVGDIQLDLSVNTKKFQQEMNGIGKTAKASTSKMSNLFSKLGKVVAAAMAVKQVARFGKVCLDLGSDLAEVQNVVDVTFGSMSENVNKFAKDAITSYGLSEKVAKEYMGQFGAMSKAFGNGTAAAYEQAEALTALSGDVASFYNLSTDEAFTKLKSVYTGETEALKSLGVVMTQTALDQFALNKGYGKTTKSMTEQEKVALRLAFVQDKLADASGDFARTSGGWANQTRVLALRFDALKASIGQGLINVLTPVIKMLNTLLAKLQTAADAFSNFTASLFGDAGGTTTGQISDDIIGISDGLAEGAESAEAIKKSLAGFDEINVLSSDSGSGDGGASSGGIDAGSADTTAEVAENTGKASKFAEKLKKFFEDIKKVVADFAKTNGFVELFEKAKQGVLDFGEGFKNIGGSFGNAISNLEPKFQELKNKFSTTFTTIHTTVNGIIGDMWLSLSEGFKTFTETHGTEIQTFFEGIIGSLSQFAIDTLGIINDIFTSINGWWETDGKELWDGIVGCLQDIGAWFLKVWNEFIQPTINTLIEEVKSLWDEHLQPLWEKILKFITSVGNFIMTLWKEIIKPAIDWIAKYILPVILPILQAIIKIVKEVFGIIADVIGGVLDILGGLLDFLTGVFTGDWESAWEGIKKIFKGIWNAFSGIVGGVVNIIIDILNGLWSSLYTVLRKIVNGIGGAIKKIGEVLGQDDWGFEVPAQAPQIPRVKIPQLASGGYVRANTPQLAIIGDNRREGEIVAPESKIAEAVAKAMAQFKGGNDRPIYLTVKLGEKDFWSGFVDYHNAEVQRTGASPLLV